MLRPALRDEAPALEPGRIRLYGAVDILVSWPQSWHLHPLTQHQFPVQHWATLAEGGALAGDIKDLWEIGRLGWLTQQLECSAE